MVQFRKLFMAGSMFSVALATGYVMQNESVFASSGVSTAGLAPPSALPVAKTATQASVMPADPQTPQLMNSETFVPEQIAKPTDNWRAPQVPASDAVQDIVVCQTKMTVLPGRLAMIEALLDAPCEAGSIVTLSHAGLKFSTILDAKGQMNLSVPAFERVATLSAVFSDGSIVRETAIVPDASAFERVGLQWQGRGGMHLHAFDTAARDDDARHFYAPLHLEHVGSAGFLTLLGGPSGPAGWQAEVFSYPVQVKQDAAAPQLSAEVEITADNCGRDIAAQFVQGGISGQSATDLTLTVPDCDAVGDIVVLGDLRQDLKIAAR